jgi:hypothetical protein
MLSSRDRLPSDLPKCLFAPAGSSPSRLDSLLKTPLQYVLQAKGFRLRELLRCVNAIVGSNERAHWL